tara:strand:+ start:1211 stop:1996 length:786 start_codon:yes stop_codon:yes gene_type:complete
MLTSKNLCTSGSLAALLLILVVPVQAISPATESETYLEIHTETVGEITSIRIWLSLNAIRIDADTQGGVSVISIGGDDGKLLMVMHQQKTYMEFAAAMMASMAGMLGQMTPEVEEELVEATQPTLTRTGNTKQVGEWAAYEVLAQNPGEDGGMFMWFSQDVGADFRTLAEQILTSMSSLLNSPIMSMISMTGGSDPGLFDEIQAQLEAVDMPDGFPVQIISSADGMERTSTLKVIDQDATFDTATWEPPEGYTKMRMPFGR